MLQCCMGLKQGTKQRSDCCQLQESVLKRRAFARKQRALKDAVRIGDQIIRRKRRMLLAGTFNAWKLRAGVYRQVARRFRASLQLTLQWAWTQWKAQLATQVLPPMYTLWIAAHVVRGASDTASCQLCHGHCFIWHVLYYCWREPPA